MPVSAPGYNPLFGAGAPGAGIGQQGSVYIRTSDNTIYYKNAGVWLGPMTGGLAAIANNRILGNFSGGVAAPVAIQPIGTNGVDVTGAVGSLTFELTDIPNNRVLGNTSGGNGKPTQTELVAGPNGKIVPSTGKFTFNNAAVPLVTPVNGDFAWFDQGGASVTVNADGGIYFRIPPNTGTQLRGRVKAVPATPYVIEACFLMNLPNNNSLRFGGLCWRDSASGKIITAWCTRSNVFTDSNFASRDYTNSTTFSADNAFTFLYAGTPLIWIKIADDGANRSVAYCFDGISYETILTEGNTTFMTPNQVGFCANTENNATLSFAAMTLLSWKQS